jgi:hypothetical protein
MPKRGSPSASLSGGSSWGELAKKDDCAWEDGPALVPLAGDGMLIGRQGDVALKINLPAISSKHCWIAANLPLADGTLTATLTDYSTNGTFVDGVRVGKGRQCIVVDGSTLSFGKLTVPKAGGAGAAGAAGGKKKKKKKKKQSENWIIPQFKLCLFEVATQEGGAHKRQRVSSPPRPGMNALSPSSNASAASSSSSSSTNTTKMSARLQRKNDELRNKLAQKSTQYATLQNQLQEVTAKLLEASKKGGNSATDEQRSAAEHVQRIEALEAKLSSAEALAVAHKDEADRQASRAGQAESELKLEKEKSATAIASKEMLAKEIKDSAAQAREDAEAREKETATIAESRKETKEARMRCTELEATVKELVESKVLLTAAVERAKEETLVTGVTLQSYKQANESASAKADELREQVVGFTKSVAAKDKSIADLERKVAEGEDTIDKVRRGLEEAAKDADKAAEVHAKTVQTLHETNERLAAVERELESTKQQVDSLGEREEIARQLAEDTRGRIQESIEPLLKLVDQLKDAARPFSQGNSQMDGNDCADVDSASQHPLADSDLNSGEGVVNARAADEHASQPPSSIPLRRRFTGGGADELNETAAVENKVVAGSSQHNNHNMAATQAQADESLEDEEEEEEDGEEEEEEEEEEKEEKEDEVEDEDQDEEDEIANDAAEDDPKKHASEEVANAFVAPLAPIAEESPLTKRRSHPHADESGTSSTDSDSDSEENNDDDTQMGESDGEVSQVFF